MRNGCGAAVRLAALVLLAALATRGAAGVRDVEVPPALEPWVGWVLEGHEYRDCPFLAASDGRAPEAHVCAWPGELTLFVETGGARFSQRWRVYADEHWIPLPGGRDHWPREVTVDGRPARAVERRGRPQLRLPPGIHSIRGRFVWSGAPRQLPVPPTTGLVDLRVGGERLARPQRDERGLWLGGAPAPAAGEDTLAVEVYRLVADNIPTRLTTELRLVVSGASREAVIGPLLPDGFVPLTLASELPARVESDGRLRAQLRPGEWTVTVEARAPGVLERLTLAERERRHWPSAEIWSYRDAPALRITVPEAEGPEPVDAGRVGVPPRWQPLPAYQVEPGDTLEIVERRRGRAPRGNELALQRDLWRDFDGGAYTVADVLRGRMHQDWRFVMTPPYELLGARDLGRDSPLLVTRTGTRHAAGDRRRDSSDSRPSGDASSDTPSSEAPSSEAPAADISSTDSSLTDSSLTDSSSTDTSSTDTSSAGTAPSPAASEERGARGVEWREREVELFAVSRIDAGAEMPVTGWQQRFERVDARLHLPPGERLLAAPGADRARGAWLERWRLLDFFLVLVAAVGAWRLLGPAAGAVALGGLALSHHEPGAPVWVWLNLLIAAGLAGVAPEGWLRRLARRYRDASLALAALVLVAFAIGQIRLTLYPQLERHGVGAPRASESAYLLEQARKQPAAQPVEEVAAGAAAPEETVVTARRFTAEPPRYVPGALLQTGPAVPEWRWRAYELGWAGPVTPEQSLSLVVMPRWLTALWRLAAVALLAALLYLIAVDTRPGLLRWRSANDDETGARATGAGMLALLAAAGIALPPASARADIPPPALLETLERRLLEAPRCAPDCADVAAADIVITERSMGVTLEVNALERVALPIPGADDGWLPERIAIDGAVTRRVYRDDAGVLWLALEPGRHQVVMLGALPPAETVTVAFPASPRTVDLRAKGWTVGGMRGRRLAAGALELTRIADAGTDAGTVGGGPNGDAPAANWSEHRYPVFLRVSREIRLGLDWSVNTTVTRLAPAQGGFSVAIPLLEGESPLGEDFPVADGELTVAFGANRAAVSWSSSLARSERLTLTAPDGEPWTEIWSFAVGDGWRAAFGGVPRSATDWATDRPVNPRWTPQFHPRPGETLAVDISRPAPAEGATLAIDAARLSTNAGRRELDATLTLRYRATRATKQPLTLPAEAELESVHVGGRPLALVAEAGELELPLPAGQEEVIVSWSRVAELGLRTATPTVDLHAPAGNVHLALGLPPQRWILATSGPRIGPAVLYWPQLAALALLAWLLGRLRLAPLASWEWFLLGLGFSTFSWPALLIVTGWLIATGWRERQSVAQWPRLRFNLLQTALALLGAIALLVLVASVPAGLLGSPDMQIAGNGSSASQLRWFTDRTSGPLPQAAAWSVPLWVYKLAILTWALWLAFALIGWLRWVWRTLTRDGLWRGRVRSPGTA